MVGKIQYSRNFLKSFRKRILPDSKLSTQFDKRILLFIRNPNHPLLRKHLLTGSKKGLFAFSITGDIRVIYMQEITGECTFLDIGSHNQVY
jgi:mRNA-degrading endonuclease YafQ of YafQ-DinJ toxin-antitoxin module